MEDFKRLSKIAGVDSIGWRYDPIFIDKNHSVQWHIDEFKKMAEKYGMVIRPCAEGYELAEYGADCSGCMPQLD